MSVKIIELDETNTCKICDNALARYSCPKCNIIYCSLNCYRANTHLECSESFYRDNILQELQIDPNSEESRTKMMEILERMHEQNRVLGEGGSIGSGGEEEEPFQFDFNLEQMDEALDSDDDEANEMDIADRLAGVDLDDAEQVWDKLTEDEKQEFVTFLKSEDVAKLIPSWQPWWLYHSNSKIEETGKEDEYKSKCPKLCEIKEFSQITTKQPSESVKYNLINILASYVFTARYFNGEHADFAREAISCVVSLSLILRDAKNFSDFETAIKSLEMEIINSEWIVSDAENIKMMKEDLDSILRGPKKTDKLYYVLCALSDLYQLIEKAIISPDNKNNFSKKFPNDFFPTVNLVKKKKMKTLLKRIEYYLSYAKYYFFK